MARSLRAGGELGMLVLQMSALLGPGQQSSEPNPIIDISEAIQRQAGPKLRRKATNEHGGYPAGASDERSANRV